MSVRARLVTAQGDPEIGTERIAVYHEDGRAEEVMLHDYARVYALPGVYEQIVQDDLGCRSPQVAAEMLAAAFARLGRDRAATRVIDIAAGNGVSGEALREAGMGGRGLIGTDIVPEARAAALRDRPAVYEEYLTLDLTALSDDEAAHLGSLGADAISCVAPVGARAGSIPPQALAATAALLAADALVVALHDPRHGEADALTGAFWTAALGPGLDAERLAHRRYLHRFLVTGAPYELEASVWRLRRPT
jgi:nucleotide-binding universal stress UspA family protein